MAISSPARSADVAAVLSGESKLPAQGLGCMHLSDARSADAVIGEALDLGIRLLDTAAMYGRGLNELLVGQAIRGRRADTIVSTKFGVTHRDDDLLEFQGDPRLVQSACDDSLKRLGVETVDIFHLHRRDPAFPIEDTVGAMADLVTAGKVSHLGLSSVSAVELQAAHQVHPIAVLQSEWSLLNRDIEAVVDTCVSLGTTVLAYSPQARGALGNSELTSVASKVIRESVIEIARAHDATPGQIALAWVQQQSDVWGLPVVPIPGTTSPEHLRQNAAARAVVLDPGDLRVLDAVTDGPRLETNTRHAEA